MGSFAKGSKNPQTQTITPKFVEEVATKVMQIYKVSKLFQSMAIVSLNMGEFDFKGEQSREQVGYRGEG